VYKPVSNKRKTKECIRESDDEAKSVEKGEYLAVYKPVSNKRKIKECIVESDDEAKSVEKEEQER
jgi:hypothetical protein